MNNKDLKKVVESALDKQKVPHVKLKKIGASKVDVASLTEPSKETRQEYWGKGLTYCAIILIIILVASIIGFIGFQARTIATFQAYLGHPVRWLPGLEIQNYADASLFADESIRWRSSYEVEKLPEEYTKSSTAELCQLAETLSLHPISLSLLERLLNSTRVNTQPDNKLAALLCARINGSPACFAAYMDSSNEYKKISPLLRKGENEINQWADRHSVERATVQAIQWLTRAPDRFSAAQFSPLLEHEKSSTQIINLLVWSGLCGWINRLKIALGETY